MTLRNVVTSFGATGIDKRIVWQTLPTGFRYPSLVLAQKKILRKKTVSDLKSHERKNTVLPVLENVH